VSAEGSREADVGALLAFVARELVDDPGSVQIEESSSGSTASYQIGVAQEDIGKVIGRHGRVAAALRTLAKAAAGRDHRRIFVDIRD
jgi:predicted RNA-binding protein YlqC (UPF0109 family)